MCLLSVILLAVFLEHVALAKLCEKSGSSNDVASKTLDTRGTWTDSYWSH